MDTLLVAIALVIAAIVLLSIIEFSGRRGGIQPKTSAGPKPALKPRLPSRPKLVSNRPQRRRRNSGGYYPVGYDGPYEDGEDFVDYLVWFAIMDAMSDDELADLGEYGEYEEVEETIVTVEDAFESEETYEAPEAETYEPIEDDEIKYGGGWDASDDSSESWGGSDDSDSGGCDDD